MDTVSLMAQSARFPYGCVTQLVVFLLPYRIVSVPQKTDAIGGVYCSTTYPMWRLTTTDSRWGCVDGSNVILLMAVS